MITPDCKMMRRLLAKFTVGEDCWIWHAATNGGGYGAVKIAGKMEPAHRVVYEILVGPIPDGLHLDHLCRRRRCVRPDHLEPVTNGENLRRGNGWSGINARKTECAQGHPYNEENTRIRSRGSGRDCRACGRERYHRRKAAT